ncbi:hypothetical protein M0R04_05725 [Candidatus Dojkabacteria bacterium]|nr:hypothetical protein [Candidatus Dojkabacteria bacterium]
MIAKVFPTIDGLQPYEAKITKPYISLYTFDTPYTVKSHGFKASWYSYDTINTTGVPATTDTNLKWVSHNPMAKFYSGKYYPIEISSEYYDSSQFMVVYEGYIKFYYLATLYFYGEGNVDVTCNGYNYIANKPLGNDDNNVQAVQISTADPEAWLPIKIKYWNKSKLDANHLFFVAKIKEPLDDHPVILSAGRVISPSDYANYSGYITGTKIDSVISCELEKERRSGAKLTFSVPLVSSSSAAGFEYVKEGEYLKDVVSNNVIKKFQMIEYHAGYRYGVSTISTITKFTGQVRKIDIVRSKNGDVANIVCYDWMSFLDDQFNTGNPNMLDYITAGYVDKNNDEGVAGDTKPRAYDSWNLMLAVENIFTNAFIDPDILYAKKDYINESGDTISSNYSLVDILNSSTSIFLGRKFNYGDPYNVDKPDDAYIWQFSMNDKLKDNLSSLLDSFGFDYGFNHQGNFYINSTKNPIKVKDIDSCSAVDWTENLDPVAISGVTYKTNTNNAQITATFLGESAKLVFSVGSCFGSVHINVSNYILGEMATFDYQLNFGEDWGFFDGINDIYGYNPCIIDLDFDYGVATYNVTITSKSTATVMFNGMLVYDRNYTTPAFDIVTGDTLTANGVVISDGYSFSNDADNIRNDIIVVGMAKGVKTTMYEAVGEDSNQQANVNNPITEHIVSRAMDRTSIGSISSYNFVGRPLQMLIIEPKISSENQAGWLAYETLLRYNTYEKTINPQIQIVGNPLIELNDIISVTDVKLNTLSTANKLWVAGVNESYTNNGFITNLTLETQEPWESYFVYPFPSLSRYDSSIFYDVNVYNTGLPMSEQEGTTVLLDDDEYQLYIAIRKTDSFFEYNEVYGDYYTETLLRIPQAGYMKVGDELIRYSSVSFVRLEELRGGNGVTGIVFKIGDGTNQLERGMFNTTLRGGRSSVDWLTLVVGKVCKIGISPYTTEELGMAPAISFYILQSGFVKVYVIDKDGVVLDVLTGSDINTSTGQYEYLEANKKHTFVWGMIDRFGAHNEVNTGAWNYAGSVTDLPWRDAYAKNVDDDWKPNLGSSSLGQTYVVSEGYYIQNDKKRGYSKARFVIEFIDPTGQLFSTPQTHYPDEYIYSNLNMTGAALDKEDEGVLEEAEIGYGASSIPTISIGTLWYNSTINDYVGMDLSTEYRYYYTGNENNGKGLKLVIGNKHNVKRKVNLTITRYIKTVCFSDYDYPRYDDGSEWVSLSEIVSASSIEEDKVFDGTVVINGTLGNEFYIKGPANVPYIAPKIVSKMDSMLNDKYLGNYKLNVKTLVIAQVHCFFVHVYDMSGRESTFTRSIWYIDPLFDNGVYQYYTGHEITKYRTHHNCPDFDGLGSKEIGFGNDYPFKYVQGWAIPFQPLMCGGYDPTHKVTRLYIDGNRILGVRIY